YRVPRPSARRGALRPPPNAHGSRVQPEAPALGVPDARSLLTRDASTTSSFALFGLASRFTESSEAFIFSETS
ncbi:MAG: hypothetical protein AAB733_00255, partial [Patescibacteria group bacterium]